MRKSFASPKLQDMTKRELIRLADRLGFDLGFNTDGTVDMANRSHTVILRGQTRAEVEEGLKGIDNPMLREVLQKPFTGPKSRS